MRSMVEREARVMSGRRPDGLTPCSSLSDPAPPGHLSLRERNDG